MSDDVKIRCDKCPDRFKTTAHQNQNYFPSLLQMVSFAIRIKRYDTDHAMLNKGRKKSFNIFL